jgi:hypothetical protein
MISQRGKVGIQKLPINMMKDGTSWTRSSARQAVLPFEGVESQSHRLCKHICEFSVKGVQ